MTTPIATIRFDRAGQGHCLYTEEVNLATIGQLEIHRATRVEFDNSRQLWQVKDLDGSLLYCSPSRATCLDWEREFLSKR
jgi:hypothetical protein